MKNETIHGPHYCNLHPFKRISWTAIFIGAIVGMGLSFLLNLFGIAIGLSAFIVGSDDVIILAVGGIFGIMIGLIVSMLAAGYAAGYLSRFYCPQRNLGIVYGFTTWSVALLLSAVVGAQVSSYVTSYTNTITRSTLTVPDDKAHSLATFIFKTAPLTIDTHQKTIKMTASTSNLAWGALGVFMLFFMSALASCVGACWGMSCNRND
ncbi:MAG: hypothetical protein NTU48_07975 [Legionellales bacterium]|nr:hypothetical protein [Legionellales bacterium]